jgi:hypothetical protein
MQNEIEQMARIICENTAISCYETAIEIAEELTAKGYRKASEVAREVLALVWDAYQTTHYDAEFEERLDRIKEKYTEGKE